MKTDATRALCQSCGATLQSVAELGTDRGGGLDPDYCRRCFDDGTFVEPHVSMFELIQRFDRTLALLHASPNGKRTLGRDLIPELKRWRNTTP